MYERILMPSRSFIARVFFYEQQCHLAVVATVKSDKDAGQCSRLIGQSN